MCWCAFVLLQVREPQPLTLHHLPFSHTCALFEVRHGAVNRLLTGVVLLHVPDSLSCRAQLKPVVWLGSLNVHSALRSECSTRSPCHLLAQHVMMMLHSVVVSSALTIRCLWRGVVCSLVPSWCLTLP